MTDNPQNPSAPGSSEGRHAYEPPSPQQGQYGQANPYSQPSSGQSAQQPYGQSYGEQAQPPYGQAGQQPQSNTQYQQQPYGQHPGAGQLGAPAPGTDISADLGASFPWMWKAFARNVAAFLVPALVYFLIMMGIIVTAVVASIAMIAATSQVGPDGEITGSTGIAPMLVMYGLSALAGIPSLLWGSGAARAAREVADGRRPTIGQGFIGTGRLILTTIVVGILTTIGSMLFVLPGLAFALFAIYAIPASARGASVGEAIKESFQLVKDHFGVTILLVLITIAGTLVLSTFIIGSIVAVPFVYLLTTAVYDRLRGRHLPEPAVASAY